MDSPNLYETGNNNNTNNTNTNHNSNNNHRIQLNASQASSGHFAFKTKVQELSSQISRSKISGNSSSSSGLVTLGSNSTTTASSTTTSAPTNNVSNCNSSSNNEQRNRTSGEGGSNLNSPEISINLQQLIQPEAPHSLTASATGVTSSSNSLAIEDPVSIFSDLLVSEHRSSNGSRLEMGAQTHLRQSQSLANSVHTLTGNNHHPHAHHPHLHLPHHHNLNAYQMTENQARILHDPYGSAVAAAVAAANNAVGGNQDLNDSIVKQEPSEEQAEYSSSCSRSSVYSPVPNGHRYSGFSPDGVNTSHYGPISSPSPLLGERGNVGVGGGLLHHHHLNHKSSKMSKKSLDKSSDEYKKRRERNNIAVRKSREKAKMRSRETEKKVSELQKANESLHKQIEMLQKELDVVKSMLNSAGIHSSTIENEVQKCLGEYRHRYGVLLSSNS